MALQKINCEQAKKMDIVTYLEQLNCKPAKVRGNDYWYYSPFHKERTPSFKVNRKLNVWYDHSLGKGGNLVDFGITYHQCSVADFLEKLNGLQPHFSFQQQPFLADNPKETALKNIEDGQRVLKPVEENAGKMMTAFEENRRENQPAKMKIIAIKDLENDKLKQYIAARAISISNAEKYCKEIIVNAGQRKFSMIGFKNNSGGFELRNIGDFKSTIAPKDVSFFQHDKPALAVVEGVFDFLSLLEKQQVFLPELTNFLVLNSLSFFEKSMPLMNEHDRVYLLLDNDAAGNSRTASALQQSQKFIDLSHKYASAKDINEWLVKEKTHAQEQVLNRSFGLRR